MQYHNKLPSWKIDLIKDASFFRIKSKLIASGKIEERIFKKNMLDSKFVCKIIDKLGNYYYERKSFNDVVRLIVNKEKKYLDGFIDLFSIYYLSENMPIMNNLGAIPKYSYKNYDYFACAYAKTLKKLNFHGISGKVMIKPNLVSKYGYPETTDIQTIGKIIQKIKKNNKDCTIIIADGPSLFFSSELSFGKNLRILSREYGAQIIDFNKSKYVKIIINSFEFFIPEELQDIEFMINLANLKAHNTVGISGAVKNHLGLIAPFQRLYFHHHGLLNGINSVYASLKANFHIIDTRKILINAQQRVFGGKEKSAKGYFYGKDAIKMDAEANTAFFGG
jgi:hypothetical protein